jgi:hypothetical protein
MKPFDPDPPEEEPRPGINEPDYDEHPDCIHIQVTNYDPNEVPF